MRAAAALLAITTRMGNVMAREKAPTIIFMDEVDSIGSARSDSGGDSEVQRTMLELLTQLDGFDDRTDVK